MEWICYLALYWPPSQGAPLFSSPPQYPCLPHVHLVLNIPCFVLFRIVLFVCFCFLWQVPTCMLEGEKGSAVRASCLLWLKDTIARKVSATWAKREQAVSQVGENYSVISSRNRYSRGRPLPPTRLVTKQKRPWQALYPGVLLIGITTPQYAPVPECRVKVAGRSVYPFRLPCAILLCLASPCLALPCPSAPSSSSSNNLPPTITLCVLMKQKVIACIKRSLEREAKVSDGVAVWLSRNFQELVVESEDEDGDEDGAGTGTVLGCLRPTLSTVLKGFRGGSGDGGATLTEKDFSALKRKEIKQAQEVDTVTAMLHHAFHLVLPHRPFKHKIMWARFTRFFQQMGLRL